MGQWLMAWAWRLGAGAAVSLEVQNRVWIGRRGLSIVRSTNSTSTGSNRFDVFLDRHCTSSIKFDKYAVDRSVPDDVLAYKDILPMWIADMDFAVPDCITAALVARTKHPIYGYTAPDFSVKSAVRSYLLRSHSVSVSETELVFLPGLVVALNLIARIFAARKKSVMTCTPIYPPFLTCAKNAGAGSVAVPLMTCAQTGRFVFDFSAMDAAVKSAAERGESVGVFLLCNPHNPVGRVFQRNELQTLVAFCKARDITLVSDEIHCELVLSSSAKHISLLSLDDDWVRNNCITLHAPSKTLNTAGLCASFAIIPSGKLRSAFKRVASGVMADIPPFGYAAMCAAYEDANVKEIDEFISGLRAYLLANVKLLDEWVNDGGVPLPNMVKFQHDQQATYLVWLDCRGLQSAIATKTGTAPNVAQWLEENAGLGLNDGATFGGEAYSGYVRINLGCTRATLHKALERFANAIRQL